MFLWHPHNYPFSDTQDSYCLSFAGQRMGRGEERRSGDAFTVIFYDLSLTAPIVAARHEKG